MEATVSLLQGVQHVASHVLQLGDNMLAADQAWVEYRTKVRSLQAKLEHWDELIEEFRLQGERNLVRNLEDAKSALENAHAQLRTMAKWEDRCGCCWHCAYALTFPTSLKKGTEFLEVVATNISTALDEQEQRRQAAEKLRTTRPNVKSNILFTDSRYVPLKGYQDDVYRALKHERLCAPLLVLLHGEQEIGKTTLAWHVVGAVKRSGGNIGAFCSSTDSTDNSGSQVTSCLPPTYDYVFFISCGLSKDENLVLKELKDTLGLKPDEDCDEDIFQSLGKRKMILLVLDDVQDSSIPKLAMKLGEKSEGLRIFITSNKSTICDSCDDQRVHVIHLKSVDREDARTILANHVGLSLTYREPSKEIVQYMDEVVGRTKGNPLALSCFATRIRKNRARDKMEWGYALERFDTALKEESRVNIYHDYPTSFWGMMRLSMEGLEEEAAKVLLLSVIISQNTRVEDAIQLLYVHLNLGTRESFLDASTILESRHLVTSRYEVATENSAMMEEAFMNGKEHLKAAMKLQSLVMAKRRARKEATKVAEAEAEEKIWIWDIHPLRILYIRREGVPKGSIRTVEAMGELIKTKLTNVNVKSIRAGDVKEGEYDKAFRPSTTVKLVRVS